MTAQQIVKGLCDSVKSGTDGNSNKVMTTESGRENRHIHRDRRDRRSIGDDEAVALGILTGPRRSYRVGRDHNP